LPEQELKEVEKAAFENPDHHLDRLYAPELEEKWIVTFIRDVKEAINPPKLPPLEVTSKPVELKSLGGMYDGNETKSGLVSLLIHLGVVALILFLGTLKPVQQLIKDHTPLTFTPITPYEPPKKLTQQGGGGGGARRQRRARATRQGAATHHALHGRPRRHRARREGPQGLAACQPLRGLHCARELAQSDAHLRHARRPRQECQVRVSARLRPLTLPSHSVTMQSIPLLVISCIALFPAYTRRGDE